MLQTKRMSIVPTFVCTLRCKLCSNHMPDFERPPYATAEEMKADIDHLFELFDRIEWLQFVGGEIFTHKHLDEVFEYCKKYDAKFDRLIIESNATIMPTDAEMGSLLSYGGKLHQCSNSLFLSELGACVPNRNDFVDLNDDSLTGDEKRQSRYES